MWDDRIILCIEKDRLLSLKYIFFYQKIIIIVLLTRYYLTKIDVSDDNSTCRDVNSSDEEGINDQGSQNDSKKYYIGKTFVIQKYNYLKKLLTLLLKYLLSQNFEIKLNYERT